MRDLKIKCLNDWIRLTLVLRISFMYVISFTLTVSNNIIDMFSCSVGHHLLL